ncbi:MAG: hypothetical protein J6S89_02715 [Paludibacteraceae bacterium]|nr:hypothetical protein [Paludibacteraceae bacterium]
MEDYKYSGAELVIHETVKKEQESGLYDIKLDGIGLYHFIKRGLRTWLLHCNGYEISYNLPSLPKSKYKKVVWKSFWQLIGLLLKGKKYNNFIYAFRTDKINGVYMDKFTDPLIEYSDVGKSYIIFEGGRNGIHNSPRVHSDKVVYADAIDWFASILAKRKLKQKNCEYHKKWDELKCVIEKTFPETDLSKTNYKYYIIKGLYIVKIYRHIFKRLRIKNFIAPARASFFHLIPAAKQQGIKVFELQHGANYGLNRMYAGRIDYDNLFMPDRFLTYGGFSDISYNAFGLLREDYIEIGWAFVNYLKTIKQEKISDGFDQRVLFISDLVIAEPRQKFWEHLKFLASQNPSVLFYYRPHPEETLNESQKEELTLNGNIVIDDVSESIYTEIMKFDNVIGINSTGLYDALNLGKKVGRFSIRGVCEPRFLSEEDEQFFYVISDTESFVKFINSPEDLKPKKIVYKSFNANVFNNELL